MIIWRNTQDRYGAVAKGFHLVIALLILGVITVGLVMTNFKFSMPVKFQIYGLHKSFGILILTLVSMRLLWRLINTHPFPLPTHKTWERTLSKVIHGLLYVLMFAMPLSGWIGSSAKGYSVAVFGFPIPDLVARNDALSDIMWEVHEVAAYGLIALIALHFAGAMKHYLIDHDETLWRMIPFVRRG